MAITKIQSESLNLADTYDFTGTVTGAGGITEYDIYRTSSDQSINADTNTLITGFTRFSNAFEKIGTGITESSSIFTFPSTGKYIVKFNSDITKSDNGNTRYIQGNLFLSTDGTNFSELIKSTGQNGTTINNSFTNVNGQSLIDVTNISNFKIKFIVGADEPVIVVGESSILRTYLTFIKISET